MNLVFSASAYPCGILADHVSRRLQLGIGVRVLIAADFALTTDFTRDGVLKKHEAHAFGGNPDECGPAPDNPYYRGQVVRMSARDGGQAVRRIIGGFSPIGLKINDRVVVKVYSLPLIAPDASPGTVPQFAPHR